MLFCGRNWLFLVSQDGPRFVLIERIFRPVRSKILGETLDIRSLWRENSHILLMLYWQCAFTVGMSGLHWNTCKLQRKANLGRSVLNIFTSLDATFKRRRVRSHLVCKCHITLLDWCSNYLMSYHHSGVHYTPYYRWQNIAPLLIFQINMPLC